MSNVQLAKDIYAAFGRGDIPTVLGWFHPEIEWRQAEGNPYKPITPARAVEEVKGIGRRVKPALVHFLDNAMSPSLLEELATRPLDLPWYGFARITSILPTRTSVCL